MREMTVFGNSSAGGGKQVFPIDYQAEVSQRLVDASHVNDIKLACECLADPFVDVNFIGTVSLKSKKTELLLRNESPHEVRVEYEEFKTDVTALFLAAHAGNLSLVGKLLVMYDKYSGRSRRFAFVTMKTAEDATVAVEKLNGTEIGGREIKVKAAISSLNDAVLEGQRIRVNKA